MKLKILGLLVFIMLLTTSLNVLGNTTDKLENIYEKKILDDTIVLSIVRAPVFLGIDLVIENIGTTTLSNVNWSLRSKAAITGTGIFINENLQNGIINEILPGESKTIQFRLSNPDSKSPIGLGNMYINASVETNGQKFRTQQRAFILGIFLFLFKDTYMDIKPSEAYERLQNNEFDLIIDVVGLDIYSLGHLPDAVNYVWADGTLRDKIPTLDPTWTYLVYCHTDPPSTDSAQAMVNAGFDNVYRLEGNFAAWKNGGYPIEI